MDQPVNNQTPELFLSSAISSLHSSRFVIDFPAWLRSCIAYGNLVALAYFQDRAPVLLMTDKLSSQVYGKICREYLTGSYLLDPFHDLHINAFPPGVCCLSEIAPNNFHRSRYFLEYYRDTGITDEIAFITYPSNGVSLHICLGHEGSAGSRFSARMLATARRISPIVISLAQAHWHSLTSSGKYAEREVTAKLISAVRHKLGISLTPRQAEVAMLILRGHSSDSIGARLGISTQTVKVFRKQLYKKCRISSQAELFKLLLPMIGTSIPFVSSS